MKRKRTQAMIEVKQAESLDDAINAVGLEELLKLFNQAWMIRQLAMARRAANES